MCMNISPPQLKSKEDELISDTKLDRFSRLWRWQRLHATWVEQYQPLWQKEFLECMKKHLSTKYSSGISQSMPWWGHSIHIYSSGCSFQRGIYTVVVLMLSWLEMIAGSHTKKDVHYIPQYGFFGSHKDNWFWLEWWFWGADKFSD